MLREWLRSERRLGIQHYAIPGIPARRVQTGPASARAAAGTASRPLSKPAVPPANIKALTPPPPVRTQAAVGSELFPDDASLPPLCREELSVEAAEAVLARLDAECVHGCTKCRLHEQRTKTVFGAGHARPEIVFVGEGPGADEDAQGIPFVGRAGQLLTRMIGAMTLTREQVYICNVVKCRPPGNRTPTDDEMQVCSPYLFRQLAVLRPRVIITLGRPATQTLLVTKVAIGRLRGQFHDFPPPPLAHIGLPPAKLMPTFHPAYLLRYPPAKAEAWDDLQQVMRLMGLQISHSS